MCAGRFAFARSFFLVLSRVGRVEVTENLSRCKNGVKFAFLQYGNTLINCVKCQGRNLKLKLK